MGLGLNQSLQMELLWPRTQLLRGLDDAQVVLEPAYHGPGDGHRALGEEAGVTLTKDTLPYYYGKAALDTKVHATFPGVM